MFPFILRPGCVQDIVMKGSSQAVEADVCACRIFTEQMWKEGKRRTFSPDWALFLKQANVCVSYACSCRCPQINMGFVVFLLYFTIQKLPCAKRLPSADLLRRMLLQGKRSSKGDRAVSRGSRSRTSHPRREMQWSGSINCTRQTDLCWTSFSDPSCLLRGIWLLWNSWGTVK